MHNESIRKDVISELKLISGGLVLMPIENFESLIKKYNKKMKPFEILDVIEENGGDYISMDFRENIIVEALYTLNTDGSNSIFLHISPDSDQKETKRMLYEDEQTMDEFIKEEVKIAKIKVEEHIEFVFEKKEEYIVSMLGYSGD